MYVSMSRLKVEPELVDQLVAAFRSRLRAVDGHAGFRGLEVWSSDRVAGEILMVSRWDDRASFTAYMRSEDHRASHQRIPPHLKQAIALQRLDHLRTYEVVAR